MSHQSIVKPVDSVEELLRFMGIGRTEAEKIKEEEILAKFSERLNKEGYSLSLMDDFAGRLREAGYPPNYIAGAIAVLLGRRAEEAEREYTLERLIRLTEKLPAKIVQELSKVSLYTTSKTWSSVVTVRLSKERPSPELIGSYPEGADCLVALPDSTGNATVHFDSSTAYGYAMRSVYGKVRVPFNSLYVENVAQPGLCLYLALGRGDITIERWA